MELFTSLESLTFEQTQLPPNISSVTYGFPSLRDLMFVSCTVADDIVGDVHEPPVSIQTLKLVDTHHINKIEQGESFSRQEICLIFSIISLVKAPNLRSLSLDEATMKIFTKLSPLVAPSDILQELQIPKMSMPTLLELLAICLSVQHLNVCSVSSQR